MRPSSAICFLGRTHIVAISVYWRNVSYNLKIYFKCGYLHSLSHTNPSLPLIPGSSNTGAGVGASWSLISLPPASSIFSFIPLGLSLLYFYVSLPLLFSLSLSLSPVLTADWLYFLCCLIENYPPAAFSLNDLLSFNEKVSGKPRWLNTALHNSIHDGLTHAD